MTTHTLPVALAHCLLDRLAETLDRPLDTARMYALTVVDPAGLDPASMRVQSSYLGGDDRSTWPSLGRPDALASATRVWLAAGGRPARPHSFAPRSPATAIAVVTDDAMGVVVRFDDASDDTGGIDTAVVLDPRRASALLMPVLVHWQSLDDGDRGCGAA